MEEQMEREMEADFHLSLASSPMPKTPGSFGMEWGIRKFLDTRVLLASCSEQR